MSEQIESASASRRNPLVWIGLVAVGLILYVLIGGDRGSVSNHSTAPATSTDPSVSSTPAIDSGDEPVVAVIDESISNETKGTIDRSLLVPPGMRARQYIVQIREVGKPFPLSQVFDKAQTFQQEGSLADAHLLFFFAARENHLPAMMVMAEMSDPLYFDAANSLLDEADAIQAYKWYRLAADLGQAQAVSRLDDLAAWAGDAADIGDADARQLLLNIQ